MTSGNDITLLLGRVSSGSTKGGASGGSNQHHRQLAQLTPNTGDRVVVASSGLLDGDRVFQDSVSGPVCLKGKHPASQVFLKTPPERNGSHGHSTEPTASGPDLCLPASGTHAKAHKKNQGQHHSNSPTVAPMTMVSGSHSHANAGAMDVASQRGPAEAGTNEAPATA